jgi:hypothetical protein
MGSIRTFAARSTKVGFGPKAASAIFVLQKQLTGFYAAKSSSLPSWLGATEKADDRGNDPRFSRLVQVLTRSRGTVSQTTNIFGIISAAYNFL